MEAVSSKVRALIEKGVRISVPATLEIAEEVPLDAVQPGAVIHAGCRIRGSETFISKDCVLGAEAPVTVENCQLGPSVELKGGYVAGATFLEGANMGSCAHIRPGTLLEEQANGAHSVGLKQTIFLPYVTAGSLINFCDALMAGGTSRKNHSEIGSSYIHFNFTPHQDKATPSRVGDVPQGVMLNKDPIFLGGQGGLVGPVAIGYGCIIPAGVVFRRDAEDEGQLLFERGLPSRGGSRAYQPGVFGSISRVVLRNLEYIGNIRALSFWYREVRSRFAPAGDPVYEGACRRLEEVLKERIKRLEDLADKVARSMETAASDTPVLEEHRRFVDAWPNWKDALSTGLSGNGRSRDAFLNDFATAGSYLDTIHALSNTDRAAGTAWLKSVVDAHAALWDV